MSEKPTRKPKRPTFSSGPCAKYPSFDLQNLSSTPFGRSHRSEEGKKKLSLAIDKSKEILELPDDYLLGIVPASDTGAVEMALWNLLGPRPVDVIAFESFGHTWAQDIREELQLEELRVLSAEYGRLPDLSKVKFSSDVVFTWNGTTSGVCVPHGDWIPDNREGLTICDATSAVFAMDIAWDKIDVGTYSWQKVMGGEAAHGMLILSPRAVERVKSYTPEWPLPKIFRLFKNGSFNEALFAGSTINTPSLLCTQDYLESLKWAESIGGLKNLIKRSKNNLEQIEKFVDKRDWISFLADKPEIRSHTSVCLQLDLKEDKIDKIVQLLAKEDVAYDISSYRAAPPGLRIWCGSTVESKDITILCSWLDWAYQKVR